MMMQRTKALAVLLALVCLWLGPAQAAEPLPLVIVLDTEEPAPRGFVDALRIQATGLARIERAGRVSGTLAEKVAAVDAPLREHDADVGVWVEPITEGELLVYVVTRRRDRVLVEVVRLPAGAPAETERALALKVRDVLDVLLAPAAEPEMERALQPPRRIEAEPPRSPWAFVVEAGALGVSSGNGSSEEQLGAAVGTGGRYRGEGFFLEAVVGGTLLSGTDRSVRGTHADTHELGLDLSARALIAGEHLAAGAHAGAGARFVTAMGTADDGRSGEQQRWVPEMRLGPEVRVLFGDHLALRGAAGLDIALKRQKFSILRDEVLDLGTIRGSAELGVVLALP